jgi:hypothetical protein
MKTEPREMSSMSFLSRLTFALVCIFALSLLPVYLAYSANDGAEGATSEGDGEIEVTIPTLFRLFNMSDLDFGTYGGTGSFSNDDDVCVFTNAVSAQYRVRARGSGADFAFEVSDGQGNSIPYGVNWSNSAGTGGSSVALVTDTPSPDQTGANNTSPTCGGTDNANFQVVFQQNDLLSTPAGTYTGVLSITIIPLAT